MSTPYAHRTPAGFSKDDVFERNLTLAMSFVVAGKKVVPGKPVETATGWTAEPLEHFDQEWEVGSQFHNHRHQQPVPMVGREVCAGSIFPDGSTLGKAPDFVPPQPEPENSFKYLIRRLLAPASAAAPEPKPVEPGGLTPEEIAEAIAIARGMIDGGADRDEIRQLLRNEGIEIDI
jgi:hypothetical protein